MTWGKVKVLGDLLNCICSLSEGGWEAGAEDRGF